ncbi:hypothetical protein [Nonomuraea sp. NEAU-A123]|uniref:hypothetical protein n=1 Tax=Nonomuraea sp. NEAU-A123 TaxID=2839649 RepID=UPI001BE4C6E3|nr:hypothetical protein [Nonomuraea sp. NEAU-A123]MBT2234713.1 hypothetical protein [Nonomuraea sp. NEAU-A123]
MGVQAGVVHGDVNNYMAPPDATPEEKFETGMRLLDSGARERAWHLINDAVVAGYSTNRVCFYWLLALLSGRTQDELPDEEIASLRDSARRLPLTQDDSWAEGVRVIRRLLDFDEGPDTDVPVLIMEFDRLRPIQRALILRHLEMVLKGQLKEQMWMRSLDRACEGQLADGRKDRVWKFFQPTPAGPRVRQADPPAIAVGTWAQALTGTLLWLAATAFLGYLLARGGLLIPLFALLLAGGVGGYLAAGNGIEWRFRSQRRRAKDAEHAMGPPPKTTAPPGGFARSVDHRFDHYFALYVPHGMERDAWFAQTAGIRKRLRDEIVEAYREKRTPAKTINWLIRDRASQVRTRWANGTLWDYRVELATPPRTKAAALLGALLYVAAEIWAERAVLGIDLLGAILTTLLIVAGSWLAIRAWPVIALEYRRYTADKAEAQNRLDESEIAFARWKERLSDRPQDREMAEWLDHDRQMLLNEALQHYRLSMRNVIAHAFLEAPAGSADRARVRGGPWRYKRYHLLVFVLTNDGVRQLAVTLDFANATFHDRHRLNYRFEAVASVRVRHRDDDERTFELTLMDGQKIDVQMLEAATEELQEGEAPGSVSTVTLDAAGLHHTLHVLEGIAAEGRAWLSRDRRRGDPLAGTENTRSQR